MILATLGFKKAIHNISNNFYLLEMDSNNEIKKNKINKLQALVELTEILENKGFVNLVLATYLFPKELINSYFIQHRNWRKF